MKMTASTGKRGEQCSVCGADTIWKQTVNTELGTHGTTSSGIRHYCAACIKQLYETLTARSGIKKDK